MSIETINILAILLSPAIAVLITLDWERRKGKQERKERLFIALMAERKSFPLSYELVKALNLIDVVFSDSKEVLKQWHEYYNLLVTAKTEVEIQERQRKFLDLVHAIASSMGYKNLKQTDIDKFYSPTAHIDQAQTNMKMQQEFIRVLENTERFVVVKRQDTTQQQDSK
jgi:hypothetical protein